MKRAAIALAVVTLLAASCTSPSTAPTAGQVRLSIVQNPTFSGDSLSFSMRLENTGQTALDLMFPSSCDVLPFFTDAAGREVTPAGGGYGCLTVITHRHLESGETMTRDVIVKKGTAPDGSFAVFPPGSYRIYARLMDSMFKVQSDPYPFTLR